MRSDLRYVLTTVAAALAAASPASAGTLSPDRFTASPIQEAGSTSIGISASGYEPYDRLVFVHQSRGGPVALSGYTPAAGEMPGPGTCVTSQPGSVSCGLTARESGAPMFIRGTEGDDVFAEIGCNSSHRPPNTPCERTFKVALGGGDDEARLWTFSDELAQWPDPLTGVRPWTGALFAPMNGIEITGGSGNDVIVHMGGPRSGRIDAGTGDDRIFTRGGYSESRTPSTGSYDITCGPGRDVVAPAPDDRVGADCEQVYLGNGDDQSDAGHDAGLLCGKARFRFYTVSGTKRDAFVDKGERACVLAVSNRASRELSDRAGKLTAAIITAFGEEFADHLAGGARESASQANLERTGKKTLKKLLPALKIGFKTAARVDKVGDAALALMIPYAAGKHLQHLKAYNGCTRLLLDVDGGRLKVSGGLLYSPKGLERPDPDDPLTRLSVYRREPRRLRPDRFTRVSSSLRCDEDGLIQATGSDTRLFTDASRVLLTADDIG
ncbi:MAG: hypothetical protein JWP18_1925 [Solirubrobacterales bacterium]|nr:hypothetical protein [Solirubrobacterales bacterium]